MLINRMQPLKVVVNCSSSRTTFDWLCKVFSLLKTYFAKPIVYRSYGILLLKTPTMCPDPAIDLALTINTGRVSRCYMIKVDLIVVCKLYWLCDRTISSIACKVVGVLQLSRDVDLG
jgi:hypothetical protein